MPGGRHHSLLRQQLPGACAVRREGGNAEMGVNGSPSSAALTVSLAAKPCLETETVFANNLFNTGSLWEL